MKVVKQPNPKKKYYRPREVESDYLKYHKLVFSWAIGTKGITQADLDMILFLYSEKIFNQTKIKDYALLMPFDKKRLEKLVESGWIVKWREEAKNRVVLYQLTHRSKMLVRSIYRKLDGLESIPEDPKVNQMMKWTNSRQRMYSLGVKKMNKKRKATVG
jgi:DNA-binding MarR family transcriptional regulator